MGVYRGWPDKRRVVLIEDDPDLAMLAPIAMRPVADVLAVTGSFHNLTNPHWWLDHASDADVVISDYMLGSGEPTGIDILTVGHNVFPDKMFYLLTSMLYEDLTDVPKWANFINKATITGPELRRLVCTGYKFNG